MKYIMYWEFKPEDIDKVMEKAMKYAEEKDKFPEKFPKELSDNFFFNGEFKGFRLYEVDKPEQITKFQLHFMPETKYKFIPIIEGTKVIELYQKMKK